MRVQFQSNFIFVFNTLAFVFVYSHHPGKIVTPNTYSTNTLTQTVDQFRKK